MKAALVAGDVEQGRRWKSPGMQLQFA